MPGLSKPKTEAVRVLLIEDNPADSEWVKRALFESGSDRFHLERAESLSSGLEFLEQASFDVMISDLKLPDGFGIEVFEALYKAAPHIPIILLTGTVMEEAVATVAIQKGAQDYLFKGKIDKGSLIRSLRYAIERCRLLAELRRKETELQTVNIKLEKKNKELKQLDQTKDEFIGNVSHELRTPLTIVRESINQIVDGLFGEVNEKQNNYLNKCLKNLDRLGKIVNDLLDTSTLEKGKLKLYKESVDIVGLVKEVIANFTPQAEKKGLEIGAVVPKGRVDVFVDKEKMVQVLTNLVGNACKFTDKGTIKVSVSENDTNIECRVKDTGIGIVPQDLPRLFSKFEQMGRQSGSGAKGTGLGLSIAKGIIELHDGQITVESEPGHGTQFIITLPKLDISQESARNLAECLRESKRKYATYSVLVFSIKNLKAELHESIDTLEALIKKQLFRQSDQTVKHKGSVYTILPETEKEKAIAVADRIRQSINTDKLQKSLKELRGLYFNIVNYPQDGLTEEELISKLEKMEELK